MAHRGRLFPVNFRRDFNQGGDISNVNAIAESYRIVIHTGVVPAQPIDGTVWIVTPTAMENPVYLKWLSERRLFQGFHLQLSVFCGFPNNPDTVLQAQFRFDTTERGRAAEWNLGFPGSYTAPFILGPGASTGVVDPAVFPRGGQFQNSLATPVGY